MSGHETQSASTSYGVGLQQAIEAVHATIELATRQGMTQARIALRPEELGDIRIHLSQTSNGLIARVTADTPVAAQALADGRAELRQSLSSLGLNVLRVDVGSPDQSGSQTREERFSGGPSGSSQARGPLAPEDPDLPDSPAVPDSVTHTIELSSGALVDVFA